MRPKSASNQSQPSLEFVLRNVHLLFLGPLIAFIVAGILWSLVFSILDEDKKYRDEQASSQAVALSKAYSHYLSRTFQQFDQLSKQMKYGWEREGSTHFLHMYEDGLFQIEYLHSVILFDKYGVPAIGSISTNGFTSVRDRDYFRFHLADTSSELRIWAQRIGPSGTEIVVLTRRLNDANGNFAGVLVFEFKPELLTLFRHESFLGDDGIMAIIGDDGIARVGTGDFSSDVLRHLGITELSGESIFVASSFNDEHHYYAAERVKGHPFVALVGLDRAKVMLSHEHYAQSYYRIGLLASLILVLVAGLSAWAAIRLHWRKQHADVLKESYRVATEGGNEGFFILTPIREGGGKIFDFEIVDCNVRGADFFGMSSDSIVGNTLRDMYSGRYAQSLIDTCVTAIENDYYEDVHHIPQSGRAKVEWLSRKFVRSGNGLSVTLRDISDAKRQETEMSKRATEDGLTSLHNRHWMMNHLPDALKRASQEEALLALLFIDLDEFKQVNDTYGHAAGDELLRNVATRMKSVIRSSDKVVRLGGDEFTIVLESIHQRTEIASIAQAVIDAICSPFDLQVDSGMRQVRIGASIGISLYPNDGTDVADLMQNADIAMYAAKNEGKRRHRFYDNEMREGLHSRRNFEKLLYQAVRDDHFVIHYQPRINTQDGTFAGMEALVRWEHPERGLMLPGSFIGLVEELGLAQKMGNLILEKVCVQIADWRSAGHQPLPVSINVCTQQFANGELQRNIESLLQRYAIPTSLIEIELTEEALQDNQIDIANELTSLHEMGITIHIDDFGTGYSSLPQLHSLHTKFLKIDEGFTAQLGRTNNGEVFFRAIISMSRTLGMIVVAEGVETAEQLKILQMLGCDQVQGAYIARALPADIVCELFSQTSLF